MCASLYGNFQARKEGGKATAPVYLVLTRNEQEINRVAKKTNFVPMNGQTAALAYHDKLADQGDGAPWEYCWRTAADAIVADAQPFFGNPKINRHRFLPKCEMVELELGIFQSQSKSPLFKLKTNKIIALLKCHCLIKDLKWMMQN
jgi:hypothetical protein